MKILIFMLLMTLSFTAFSASPNSVICSLNHAKIVVPIAEKHSSYDKNRHCSVSCMLSLKCNRNEVMLVGVLKEVKDLFGPGNAERADIVADKYGISLVRNQRARNNSECLEQCDQQYR